MAEVVNTTKTEDVAKAAQAGPDEEEKKSIERICVLAAGSFGTAIGSMFARNGHPVIVLDRNESRVKAINEDHKNPDYLSDLTLPTNLTATTDPVEAFKDATMVFHAVPIQGSRKYLEQFKEYIKPHVPIISMSKGIHCESLQFMNDIVAEVFGPDQLCAFLSGPSFAREIVARQPTGLVIASADVSIARKIACTIAHDPRVRVWTTNDVIGVEVGGALKNIYAIGAGIVEGAGFGYNPTAMLVTRGCSEMKKLAVALGARPETLSGLSGIGDLMLTCFGPASRNRAVGVRIGKGEKLDEIIGSMREVAEGVPTILAAHTLATRLGLIDRLPLLKCIHATVHGGLSVAEALEMLMQLPVIEED